MTAEGRGCHDHSGARHDWRLKSTIEHTTPQGIGVWSNRYKIFRQSYYADLKIYRLLDLTPLVHSSVGTICADFS